MFANFKQLIYLAAIPAVMLNMACGGNNATKSGAIADSISASTIDTANGTQSITTPLQPTAESKPDTSKPAKSKPMVVPVHFVNKPSFENKFQVLNRPQELIDGIKLATDGDLPGAIIKFDATIAKNPKNGDAYFYRAKAEIELNQYDKAMEDLNKAIAQKKNEALFFYYRGKLYSDSNREEEALADFTTAISLRPNFPDAFNYRGVALAKQQKHKEAIADYDNGIKGNPNYAILYYNKGTSQAGLKDYNGAIETLSKCLELDPKNLQAYLNLGNSRLMNDDVDGAISDFDKLIALNPKSADGYLNRGYAKFIGKRPGICDDWKKALSLGQKQAEALIEKNCK